MKIIRASGLEFIPASHEDPKDPGALKKVLLQRADLPEGKVQMINWAKIPKGKAFASHYHEAMVEIFIIISGEVKIIVDQEEDHLGKGDMVIIPEGKIHSMQNLSDTDMEYLTIGIVTAEGGKTINV